MMLRSEKLKERWPNFLIVGVPEARIASASPRDAWARFIFKNDLMKKTARVLIPAALRRMVKRKILLTRSPKPTMPQETKKFPEELYRADVRRLEQILGRSLPWSQVRNNSGRTSADRIES